MSRPMLPLDVNKVDSVGQQEAMIGIEDDDVKERQTELNLKMTTEADLCVKDGKQTEGNHGSDVDNVISREDIPPHQKRRKTRRGRAKRRRTRPKPYSKNVWEEKKLERERRRRSVNEALTEVFIHGQPVAPYNTTQFLIDDHNSFPDLDVQLQAVGTAERPTTEMLGDAEDNQKSRPANRPSRTRDSSFSIDSDDDYFYSSPEDEGEFLTKEFSNTYEVVHAERLGTLSKTQLIQDYVQLEEKVDMLEKKLQKRNSSADGKGSKTDNSEETSLQDGSSEDTEQDTNNVRLNEPLNLSQEEITKLIMENERLTRENERLRVMCSQMELGADAESVSSSVDSESDSSSSTYSSVGEESADSTDRTNTSPVGLPIENKTSPVESKTSPIPVPVDSNTSPIDSKVLPLDA